MAPRKRRELVVARPDGGRVARRADARGLRGPRQRLRGRAMDRGRRDRDRRADAGVDVGARVALLVARRGRLRQQGSVGDAQRVRRARREAVLMDGPADAVTVQLEALPDEEAATRRGAELIAAAVREAVRERAGCAIAVSGGATPVPMFEALAGQDVPWEALGIWQVDERVAPRDDEDRSLKHLLAALPAAARVHEMPVDGAPDGLEARAATYAAGLPARFDLVHLGIGDDGHTASLVPGDPLLEARDRDVALTRMYRGRRRMTLTYPVLDRARSVLFLVTGQDKASALQKLLARDQGIPAARVRAADQRAIVDRPALRIDASDGTP